MNNYIQSLESLIANLANYPDRDPAKLIEAAAQISESGIPLEKVILNLVEVCWVEFFASFIAVPERYDMKPGSIGRMHGDRKEAKPAPAETRTLVSITNAIHQNNNLESFKHISKLHPNEFQIKQKCESRAA
jgi:hypothetical protein